MTKARDLANIANGVPNSLITLDANEIPNLDTAKITTGTFADARISQSSVSQHATSFDDSKIQQDLMVLALQQATDANKAAYSLSNSFVEQFEDSTGIDVQTNTGRDTSEYISTNTRLPESGGTEQSASALSFTDYPSYGYTYGSSIPDTIQTESSMDSYNWSAYSTNQITNKFWVRFSVTSINSTASETSNNPKFQFGITSPDQTSNTGQSLYNNNLSNSFWFGYRGNNATNIYTYKAQTVQATIAKTLATGHSLQLTGDGTNLKLYHSSSSNTWYDNGADLIHTFTNFSDNGADKRFFIGAGTDDWDGNQAIAQNFSWKDNITSLSSVVFNSSGNFTSVSQTAPATVSKMGIVVLYKNNAGTATLNTDLVAQVSANNGTDYTTVTLTPRGTFSTGINIAVANNVTVTSGTSCKYKISFANQSAGTKETQVHGVGLIY